MFDSLIALNDRATIQFNFFCVDHSCHPNTGGNTKFSRLSEYVFEYVLGGVIDDTLFLRVRSCKFVASFSLFLNINNKDSRNAVSMCSS